MEAWWKWLVEGPAHRDHAITIRDRWRQRAEQVFLTLLDRFTRAGRNVSDRKGTTYAPAMFAKEHEAMVQKLRKEALADAMTRLFASEKIRVPTEGPQSRHQALKLFTTWCIFISTISRTRCRAGRWGKPATPNQP